MDEDQTMFLKSATTSAVGFALMSALPGASEEVTFSWLAVGEPVTTVSHGLDYYGSYRGTLVFTDDNAPLQQAVVHCPGFRGHDFSQEGICTIIEPNGDQMFIKWQCAPAPISGPDMIAACDGEIQAVGGSGRFQNAESKSDFRAVVTHQHPDGSLSGYSEMGAGLFDD